MKVCVTAQGDNLETQVDPRFGRCQYFIIVDPQTLEFEAIQNPNIQAMGGAGIQSAQLVASKGVEVVLTGNVGPNAFRTLEAAGIKIVIGIAGGSVREALERFKKGDLEPVEGPSVGTHFGMRSNSDSISSTGAKVGSKGSDIFSTQKNLEELKKQAKNLQQQLDKINKRIDELTKG